MRERLIYVLTGVVVGAALGAGIPTVMAEQSRPAAPGQFTECFAATVAVAPGRDLMRGAVPSPLVPVPRGWTVVSGAGNPNGTAMLLCR